MAPRETITGTISSAAFDDHQFVVGCWPSTSIGPIRDVMWRRPDGSRTLLVGSDEEAAFITSIYEFDEVIVDALSVESDGRTTRVVSPVVELDLVAGRARRIPLRRPLWFTRRIEAPIARALMGVETWGTSPRGATEWYQASAWRWVVSGACRVRGVDRGGPSKLASPMGVGFSEPPPRPSIVSVRVTIDRP